MSKRICTMIFRTRNAWQATGAGRGVGVFIMCWLLVAGFFAMGQTSELTIDSFQYSTDSAAQAAWTQSHAGHPVTLSMTDGVSCLALQNTFTTDPNFSRGLWAKNVSLDLSADSFIAMRLKSTRTSMRMSLYFMTTNGGYYVKYFYITSQWATYVFPLGDFGTEGTTPGGWGNVTGVYISCWSENDISSATVYVSNLRASAGLTTIDSFQYSTESAAQAAWSQLQDAQPVTPVMDGVNCLDLQSVFTAIGRALWAKSVSLDLSASSFITMRLKSSRPSMRMSLYFMTTGGGYYVKNFYITSQWATYVFPLGDFGTEGTTPGGWDNVTGVYISCWSDGDVSSPAHVYVSNLRASANLTTIDSFQYSNLDAAQAAWSPTQAGQPVTPTTNENVSCLALPCAFTASTVRGLWVKNVSLDLSANSFITIRLKSTRSYMGMHLYFMTTGGGCYAKHFYITDQWSTYVFPLGDFGTEGTVSGWNNVTGVYISCWQETDPSPAAVYVSDLHAISGSLNLLLNSGFEVTTSEAMPDYWGPTSDSWGTAIDQWVLYTDSWRANWGVDRWVNHTPGGTNSLRIISSGTEPELKAVANWTTLTANTPSTLSVWLKSNQSSLPVTLKVFFYTDAEPYVAYTEVTTSDSWQRYSLTFTPTCSSSQVSCFIYPTGAGTLWVDDVQLEDGTSATKWKASLEDPYIEHQTVHKTVPSIGDHTVIPGGNSVTVSIDSYGRFLVDGQPFIPMGIVWGGESIPSPEVTHYIAQAGFNTIQFILCPSHSISAVRAFLDSAKAYGLKVIVMADRTMSFDALGTWVDALKDHPSVIIWYVYDEPNTQEEWQNATAKYNLAKTNDPSRPAMVNVCQVGQLSQDWTSDVLTMDRYPIGNGNMFGKMSIGDIGTWVEALHQTAATTGKPVWCWLQSIGYAYYCSREPTGAEAECMAYQALIHGSRGIMYFAQKPRTMEQWNEMRILTDEVRTLTPALSSTDTAPTFSANSSSIHLLSKSCGGNRYLIAVNDSPLPVTAALTSSETGSTSAAVLFENRNVNVVNGTITDTFAGYQRHVYIAYGAW